MQEYLEMDISINFMGCDDGFNQLWQLELRHKNDKSLK
jgi:hypothetical protein